MPTAPQGDGQPLDRLDRELIEHLRADPRTPYASLGTALGVTGMTAANRLNRILDDGLALLRVEPNFQALGIVTEIMGFAQVDVAAQDEVCGILLGSPFVVNVSRVTGEFDLCFEAAFHSDAEMGDLVRDLQGVDGVRRLVVYHRMDRIADDDGWRGVWAEPEEPADLPYELAPGTTMAAHLEPWVARAAAWVNAITSSDLERLRELSTEDIEFIIRAPHRSEGTYAGIEAVEGQSRRTNSVYERIWYRIVSVTEHEAPYTLIIDALSPVETRRGRINTAFSRMAFGFEGTRIARVMSLGQMHVPEAPRATVQRNTA